MLCSVPSLAFILGGYSVLVDEKERKRRESCPFGLSAYGILIPAGGWFPWCSESGGSRFLLFHSFSRTFL